MSHDRRKSAPFHLPLRAFLLLLALTLLPALPAPAEEKTAPGSLFGSELMDSYNSILSSAVLKDTLYVLTSASLYAFAPGDERARRLTDSRMDIPQEDGETMTSLMLSYILSDGERLLGFCDSDRRLYTVNAADGSLHLTDPIKLDMDDLMEGDGIYAYLPTPVWMRIMEGRLYIKFYNYGERPVDLYSFDLKTGEKQEHKSVNLQAVAPYKDGTYLAVLKDPQQYYDEAGERVWPKLVVYNPKDESVTPHASSYQFDKSEAETFSLYYDAEEDSLYTSTDTDLYRLDGDFKTPRLIGYLPTFGAYMQSSNAILPLSDGRLAVLSGQNAFIRERTEEGLKDTAVLTMIGNMDDPNLLTRVMMEMDNVVVRRMEGTEYNQLTSEQKAALFLTGSIPADLMIINSNDFDIDSLIKKGYLADLSGNEKVSSFVNSMAPNLTASLLRDGKLYSLLTNVMLMPLTVYPERFKELGLEIPTSVMGLLNLTEEWVDGLGEQNPDYALFSFGEDMQSSLRTFVLGRYMADTLGTGEELTFDTPVFRKLMQRLSEINFGDYAQGISPEQQMSDDFWEEVFSKKQLIEPNVGFDLSHLASRNFQERSEDQTLALILPLDEGMDAFTSDEFSQIAVLQTSKNKELAIEFLGHYVDKMDKVMKAALTPEATEPIENPSYEQEKQQYLKYIANLEAQLKAAAEEAQKSNLEANIKEAKEGEKYLESRKYLATSESLEMVHAYVSHMYIMSGRANAQRQAYYENYDLRQQYFDGVISLDQFIKQMDDKLRLVRLEYQ